MSPLTNDEIADLRKLLEIEAIKKKRLLYSHLLDSRRIDELAEIFTEDAICDFGSYGRWEGRETIRSNYHKIEKGLLFRVMHGTCDHLVELTGSESAAGRSYLFEADTVKKANENPFFHLGVYDERYRKVDGSWLIEYCALRFFWPQREEGHDFVAEFPSNV
jgi:hypothetical protein